MHRKRLLELKARCWDLTQAAAWCAQHATFVEDARQVDTYFLVGQGRLKLRRLEGRDEGTLIYYQREDSPDAKRSRVSLLSVTDPAILLSLLREALGILVEVRKRRRIFRWREVQVHLDEVAGLGSFIEFERLVDSEDDETQAQGQFAELRTALGVRDEDLVSGSYSDLGPDSSRRRA